MGEKTGSKLLKGAAVLGIAGVIVKVMGMVFRIPLTNWLGSEGMAYYGAAYPIYSLLLIISTAGIPVAISKMVAERTANNNYGGAYKVFTTALKFMVVLGFICFAICFFGADLIAGWIGIPKAALSLKTIAPALFVVPILSSFRGYFQGRQSMNPTAVSELVEQFCRVTVGLACAYMLLSQGLEQASAGATFGASVGSTGGLILIASIFLYNKKKIKKQIADNPVKIEPTKSIVWKILAIAIPITIGAAIFPIMSTIDTAMIVNRLEDAGFEHGQAEMMFGLMTGYCGSLIGFPQIFTQAISVSLVPAISAAYEKKNMEEVNENITLSLRATLIMGFPCAIGIFVLAEPVLLLLYPAQPLDCHNAAPTLMVMALGIIFLSKVQTLTGALQGIGKQMKPVKNMAIGAVAKIILTYVLVGIYEINILGAAAATIVAYIVASVLNIRDIKKAVGTKFNFKLTYIRPGIASIVMGVVVYYLHMGLVTFMPGPIATIVAIIVGAVVYLGLILVLKAITRDELLTLPGGSKLVRILDKIHK